MENQNCVFCKIFEDEKDKIIFENGNLIIIQDIKPASEHHYLAIPKKHIADATQLSPHDKPLQMENELKKQLASVGIKAENASFGFHWPPFISVKHLHMHGIGPTDKMGFISRWIFKPLNLWYRTPQNVAANIKGECQLGK